MKPKREKGHTIDIYIDGKKATSRGVCLGLFKGKKFSFTDTVMIEDVILEFHTVVSPTPNRLTKQKEITL